MNRDRPPDRLIQLIEQALDHRPSKFDADPRRYLKDHGLSESDMPIWYRGGSRALEPGPLGYESKKWAAPFIVWLRRWVKPLLEELASEPSATKVLLDALPPPLPVPCRVKEDGRIEPVDEQAREAFNTTFDVPPVHLWQLWRRWKPVTGLDGMPDVPPYPGAVCPPKAIRKGCRYKSGVPDSSGTEGNGNCGIYENCPWRFGFALVCGPFNTLAVSLRAPHRVELTCDALNWLRQEVVRSQGAKKPSGKKGAREPAGTNENDAQKLRRIADALGQWGREHDLSDGDPEKEREAARKALLPAVKNREVIKRARVQYDCAEGVVAAGVFDKLETVGADYDRGGDLGGRRVWVRDLTEKHLPGNVSFPDELDRWASRLEQEARSDKEQPESAMTVKDIVEVIRAAMQPVAQPTGTQTTSKVTPLKKPAKIAFVASAVYTHLGNQQAVADNLKARYRELCDQNIIDPEQRAAITQGDVSKWCTAVRRWRAAGNPMPSPDEFKPSETIQTVDPKVLDMGPREDHHAPRQRASRDPDSVDDWD